MERVVFLDRDGTINQEVNYLHRPEDLEILPGVVEAVKMLREAGFRIVVVTNQAGVARGYYTCQDVEKLHEYLNEVLEKDGAGIDHFFYCPHHPVHGVGEYKRECSCRKPGIGMFQMAEQYYQIDKEHSYMIGDKLLDVEAGRNYGVHSILVGTGYGAAIYREMQGGQEQKDGQKRQDGQEQQNGQEQEDGQKWQDYYQQPEAAAYDFYAETLIGAAEYIIDRER